MHAIRNIGIQHVDLTANRRGKLGNFRDESEVKVLELREHIEMGREDFSQPHFVMKRLFKSFLETGAESVHDRSNQVFTGREVSEHRSVRDFDLFGDIRSRREPDSTRGEKRMSGFDQALSRAFLLLFSGLSLLHLIKYILNECALSQMKNEQDEDGQISKAENRLFCLKYS